MAKKATRRIPSRSKSVRKLVPVTLLEVTDKYKREIQKNLKDKHKDALTDKVVLEIVLKSLNDMPDKKLVEVIDKNIPKKYRKR